MAQKPVSKESFLRESAKNETPWVECNQRKTNQQVYNDNKKTNNREMTGGIPDTASIGRRKDRRNNILQMRGMEK